MSKENDRLLQVQALANKRFPAVFTGRDAKQFSANDRDILCNLVLEANDQIVGLLADAAAKDALVTAKFQVHNETIERQEREIAALHEEIARLKTMGIPPEYAGARCSPAHYEDEIEYLSRVIEKLEREREYVRQKLGSKVYYSYDDDRNDYETSNY